MRRTIIYISIIYNIHSHVMYMTQRVIFNTLKNEREFFFYNIYIDGYIVVGFYLLLTCMTLVIFNT
jgi:hypothetical protein